MLKPTKELQMLRALSQLDCLLPSVLLAHTLHERRHERKKMMIWSWEIELQQWWPNYLLLSLSQTAMVCGSCSDERVSLKQSVFSHFILIWRIKFVSFKKKLPLVLRLTFTHIYIVLCQLLCSVRESINQSVYIIYYIIYNINKI